MSNKDLFKEAIADAKAVREAALANAKVALEEALAPRLQTMLSTKLQEMEEDLDEAEDKKEELDEMDLFHNSDQSDLGRKDARMRGQMFENEEEGDENLEEDFDLSEILAELEADEIAEAKKKKKDDELNEAEEGEEEEGEEEEEEEAEEEGDEEEPEMEAEPAEDSGEKLTDLTVDELKDIIKDIISAEMGGADMGGGDEMDMDMGDMGGEEGGAEDEIAVDEDYDGMNEEDIDLEELLAELDALDESEDDLYEIKRKDAKKKEDAKKKDEKKEIDEAIATINTLRSELNEVNLLNAKLLYVNKIFKAKNLNESQKLKVIAQFDKATTAKEAKTIFESMSTAIAATSSTKKGALKESIGFASKAAGVAPKKNIVEVDETMSRWQMLAGIKKF
jgi:hypothetical protein